METIQKNGYEERVTRASSSRRLATGRHHKCLIGTRQEALAACSGEGGQIGAYADAIAAATGKRAQGASCTWSHTAL